MNYLIGIDLGTSSTKTVLFDEKGEVIASASKDYPLYTPHNGWAEQKPEDWRDAALETITKVVKDSGVAADDIKGLGISGQMHGLVMLDEQGEVIRPSIIWCDQRTEKECEEMTEKVGAEKLIEITANPAMTGFMLLRGQFALDHGWADVFINSKKEDVEARVKELTEGRGADAVIEAAGKDGTFQLAWKIARPNAVISLLAMYEEDQVLPLPSMYGKNLTWKSGGVDACKDAYLVQLISEGKLDPTPLFNKEYTLNEIAQVYEDFAVKRDGLIKPVIKPYEY